MSLKQADFRVENSAGANQLKPKVLQVRARYLKALKIFSGVTVVLVISLTYTISKLNEQSRLQQEENARLLNQVSELKTQVDENVEALNLVTAQKDSSNTKALGYIESIQAKLKTINNYLSRRGLKGVAFKPVKTNNKSAKVSNTQIYKRYNRYLSQLVDNIAEMPMGYPKISSFTSLFGYRGNPFNFGRSEFHPGLDFKGQMGEQVKCTASGKVIFTGRAGGYGNCVRIRHINGIETWYGHLSRITVREGERVNVGEVVGRVGSTGRSTGPHLHYEVRKDGKPVNPTQYLTLN
ncbi:peptidoglycan DD-metalloendopeptidase family protein [Mucilaginibacter sp. Bleaf8]|uniref:M23 family metallopeptidase n=1 Tax=Mucilaginibacter sp. Bleaf8 TaxID=2834430 RepID=UPI001BCCD031|nr:M23 family metallopeptidase [Mucilaginibacter sp. Bleaf8]MBS7564512.1 peptidoglycan DD-metalloendopeptidase family protein [Mucilaginibacter sp. Bleaf8]